MSATTEGVPAVPETETINQLITMTFAPEHEAAFLELATSVVAQVRANEPDTLIYMLTKHPERDHTYVWIESYRDQDALAVHSDAPYIADALAKLPDWWSAPPEAIQLRQVLSI
jgi:quinol monooxygenase YgiN